MLNFPANTIKTFLRPSQEYLTNIFAVKLNEELTKKHLPADLLNTSGWIQRWFESSWQRIVSSDVVDM